MRAVLIDDTEMELSNILILTILAVLWMNSLIFTFSGYIERYKGTTKVYKVVNFLSTFLCVIIEFSVVILLLITGVLLDLSFMYILSSCILVLFPVSLNMYYTYYGPRIRSLSMFDKRLIIHKEEDLVKTCIQSVVVGGGWSFYLQKNVPLTNLVFWGKSFKGKISKENEMWYANTTLAEVQRLLRKRNMTLASFPSINESTLGGWVFSGSHGSGGTLWKSTIGKVKVYNKETQEFSIISNKKILFDDTKTMKQQQQYIIISVELKPMPDVDCNRIAFDINDDFSANRYLTEESYLRLIFVHAGISTAFLWVPKNNRNYGNSSWFMPPWLWSILPSSIFKYPRYKWFYSTKLSNAHNFGPTPPMIGTIFSFNYINFEIFVYVTLNSVKLLNLCKSFESLFQKEISGRCEIRGGKNKTFLDFAVSASHHTDTDKIFNIIYNEFGSNVKIYLHKGKAQVKITSPSKEYKKYDFV